ncbi:hypothetical protein BDC45DRAFT_592098 [Circinella umbellata]|nr:hypothetical protein BDC45DRAFT_592098 [Circinella umbellata]
MMQYATWNIQKPEQQQQPHQSTPTSIIKDIPGSHKHIGWSPTYNCDHRCKQYTTSHHNPVSEVDIRDSRHPLAAKNWMVGHVKQDMDWRGMKNANLIQQRLIRHSRQHQSGKQSTETWVGSLNVKGYDTLFGIINVAKADEKEKEMLNELLLVEWISP